MSIRRSLRYIHLPIMALGLAAACVEQISEEIPSESAAAPAVLDDLLLAASRVALPPGGIGLADLPEADSPGRPSLRAVLHGMSRASTSTEPLCY